MEGGKYAPLNVVATLILILSEIESYWEIPIKALSLFWFLLLSSLENLSETSQYSTFGYKADNKYFNVVAFEDPEKRWLEPLSFMITFFGWLYAFYAFSQLNMWHRCMSTNPKNYANSEYQLGIYHTVLKTMVKTKPATTPIDISAMLETPKSQSTKLKEPTKQTVGLTDTSTNGMDSSEKFYHIQV